MQVGTLFSLGEGLHSTRCLTAFGFTIHIAVCVFVCEPLVLNCVVNLPRALRYTETPHHGSAAAGRKNIAASQKKHNGKPETSVTPNAPSFKRTHTHTDTLPPKQVQTRPDRTSPSPTAALPQTSQIPLSLQHSRDVHS